VDPFKYNKHSNYTIHTPSTTCGRRNCPAWDPSLQTPQRISDDEVQSASLIPPEMIKRPAGRANCSRGYNLNQAANLDNKLYDEIMVRNDYFQCSIIDRTLL